jgi:hypothetical protein
MAEMAAYALCNTLVSFVESARSRAASAVLLATALMFGIPAAMGVLKPDLNCLSSDDKLDFAVCRSWGMQA